MKKVKLHLYLIFYFLTLLFCQAQNLSVDRQKAEQYFNQLQIAYNEGNYKNHKLYSDSLLVVAKKNEFHKMHVLALTNQAIFYNGISQRETAIKLYHEALKVSKLIPNDFKTKAVVLINMGNTYNNIGEYEKANDAMKKVIKTANNVEGSYKIKAAALIGIADNYTILRDYKKALEYSYLAKDLGENNNDELVKVSSVNKILDIFLKLKKYQEVLDISKSIANNPFFKQSTKIKAEYLLNIGIANYYLNITDSALISLNACKKIAENKNLLKLEMNAYEYLAKVHEQKNDFEASYDAQKKFTSLKEIFLNDTKNATNTDLKEDILIKEKHINRLSEKSNKLLIYGALSLFVLSLFLFFIFKRKKKIEIEKEIIKAENLSLEEVVSFYKKENKKKAKPYRNTSLTQRDRETLKTTILEFMNKEKPYLNPDINQAELASKIGLSAHNLSEVLNHSFGQNFYNFINSYRVFTAQKLIKDKNYKNTKMIAIAFDSGFKSKTSFNRVFKKHTGLTPSEYRETH